MRIPLTKGDDGKLALEVTDDMLQKLTSMLSSQAEVKLKESQDKPAELEGPKSLVDQVAAWVDTRVIAELVVDHLKAEGRPKTFEEAKSVWLDALESLGAQLGQLKEKLTMDDFTPIEKATFVLAWGAGMSPEQKATFAQAVGIPLAGAAKAGVAESKPGPEPEVAEAEERPLLIQGETDLPGYEYFPHTGISIKKIE